MKEKIKNKIHLWSIGYSIILLIIISTGCKKTDGTTPSSPGANEVWMQNTTFNPSTLTVSVNTTVTWTNKDNMNHTVTSNTGEFDSGILGMGNSFAHKFTIKGTYDYHCNIHSVMTGKIIVN